MREHTELCWVLATVASYGELLSHDPVQGQVGQAQAVRLLGLFFYPVLQAADILAYDTDQVPVGEDQKQHIELTRDIAQRFNARFGETLVVPSIASRRWAPGSRTCSHRASACPRRPAPNRAPSTSWTCPSRSSASSGSAVTDSGTEIVRGPDKAGITNLIEILSVVHGVDPSAIEGEFAGLG